MHRGFTHSLVGGVVVMPPMLSGLLWLLDRWQVSRGATFKSGLAMRSGWLLALCLSRRAHPSVARPADDLFGPAAVAVLGRLVPCRRPVHHRCLGVAAARPRRSNGRGGRKRPGKPWQRPVQAAIAILLAYIGINLLITQRAYAAVRNWAGERQVEALFASPPPVQFWRRGLVWREGDCYRRSRVRSARRRARRCHRVRPDRTRRSAGPRSHPPRSRARNRSCAGRSFRRPTVERSRCSVESRSAMRATASRGRSRLGARLS